MWKKRIYDWLKMESPIISIVSLAGCVALSIVCIIMGIKISKMSNHITETNDAISNYATGSHFTQGEKQLSLLDILRQHELQINDLYNRQRQISNYQSNLQDDINRSNRFLNDYNSARFFEDDWPMKQHY